MREKLGRRKYIPKRTVFCIQAREIERKEIRERQFRKFYTRNSCSLFCNIGSKISRTVYSSAVSRAYILRILQLFKNTLFAFISCTGSVRLCRNANSDNPLELNCPYNASGEWMKHIKMKYFSNVLGRTSHSHICLFFYHKGPFCPLGFHILTF